LTKVLPVGLGMLAGAVLATALAGRPADAAQAQDPAVQMQIQQALNNFQIQLRNELNQMQTRITELEREQQRARLELNDAARGRVIAEAPIPSDPIPGTPTYGRLVSEVSQSYRYELHSPRGELLAQLGVTEDGPGLLLFDLSGQISAALLATPTGPELRMVDADGNLQTLLSGR
jgi:hypothetical protein